MQGVGAVSSRYSPLELWHLLSLDAPTVAAVWTAFVGWTAGIRLPWTDVTAMFTAVWMLYAADRLLDAKPLFTAPASLQLEERHRFHHRHGKRFVSAILCASLPLVVLLHLTSDAVLHLYVLLASLLFVWLLLVHARPAPSTTSHRLPKELAVGIFFPAAVFIPTVARAPALRPALAVCALSFALLCTLNCLFLFAWEHPHGSQHVHSTTRWAVRHLTPIAFAGALLGNGLLLGWQPVPHVNMAAWPHAAHPRAVPLACLCSGALLLLLHARRRSLSPLTLRALADLVLLTPLPVAFLLGHHV